MKNEPSAGCDLAYVQEVADMVKEKSEHLPLMESPLVPDGAEVGGPIGIKVGPGSLPNEIARLTIHIIMRESVGNPEPK